MMNVDTTEEVCTDCLVWIVNNDDSGAHEDWRERYEHHQSQLEENYHWYMHGPQDPFSRTPCFTCGDKDAGARFEMIGIIR